MQLKLNERLGRFFLVTSGEWSPLFYLTGLNALLVGGLVVGLSVAGSLFLKRVGPESLPGLYLLSALTTLLVSPLYLKVVDVVPRKKLLLSSYAFFMLAPLVMRLTLSIPGALQVLLLLTLLITHYSTLQVWLLATDLFDPRSAKRLFPLVGGGGSLGAIVSGVLVNSLAELLHAENLMLLWCLLMVGCFVLLARIFRRFGACLQAAEPQQAELRPAGPTSLLDDLKVLRGIPIMIPATAIHCLVITVSTLVDFQYNKAAAAALRSEDALSAFLGAVYGGVSFLGMVVQFSAIGRFVRCVGIVGAMLFQPIVLIVPGIALLASPNLFSATLARVTDQVLQISLYSTTSNVIYGAAPPHLRGRLSVFLKAVASPLSVAAAGVFLLMANRAVELIWVVAAIPVLIVAWMGAVLGLRNRYITTLVSNLAAGDEEHRLEAIQALESIGQGPAVDLVRKTLTNEKHDLVLFGLELAAGIRASALERDVSALLTHPSAEIRRAAVLAFHRIATPLLSSTLQQCMGDPDPAVRLEIVATLEEWDPGAMRQLAPARARIEQDPRVLARLLRFLSTEHALPDDLRRRVREMSRSQDVDIRRWAARALDGVADEELTAALLELVEDPNAEVRSMAIHSAAAVSDLRVLPYLVMGLRSRDTRSVCERGLVRFGESTLPVLMEGYDRDADLEGRRAVLRLLGNIGGRQAHDFMMDRLTNCPEALMGDLVRALHAVRRDTPVARNEIARVVPSIMQSVNRAMEEALVIAALQRTPDPMAVALLVDESVRLIRTQKSLVLEQLSLLTRHEALGRVKAYLDSERRSRESSRERNLAVEALETLLPVAIRAPVVALMDSRSWEDLGSFAHSSHRPLHEVLEPADVLRRLLAHPDPWTQTCAAFAAGRLELREFQGTLEQLATETDRLLSETCRDALSRWTHAAADPKKGSPMTTTLSTMEKILFLRQVSLFQGLTARDLNIVAQRTTEVEFHTGQIIFEEGEPGTSLYIIVRGTAAVMVGRAETRRTVAILGARECVGEMAVLSGDVRTASVEAIGPLQALKIGREDFRALILEHPHFAFSIFEILIRRLRATAHLYQDLPLLAQPGR